MPLTRPPFDTIALVLQGGGALGAYQAGVMEGLSTAGINLPRGWPETSGNTHSTSRMPLVANSAAR